MTAQLEATGEQCGALAAQNEAMRQGQSKLAQHVEVAINFVEWFAERGEACVAAV